MGTRSLTFVYTEHRDGCEPIMNMYRQFDGYPEGHGLELAMFLNSFDEVVNGIPVGDKRKLANGMCCLSAQMVAHFKDEAGGFYLYPVSARECGQEYEYHVYSDRITVLTGSGEHLFTGPWKQFLKFCKTPVTEE